MRNVDFHGIDGLSYVEPYGAIVSTAAKALGGESSGSKGHRAKPGQPIRKGRFHISATNLLPLKGAAGSGYAQLRHPPHPGYQAYNSLPDDDPRSCRLHGNLLFVEQDDNEIHHLLARKLTPRGRSKNPPGGGVWEAPPNSAPSCTGDGNRAKRFNGLDESGKPTYVMIDCPHDLCVFRQGNAKACGAFGMLYFRLCWPGGEDFPSELARYQTHGWDSVTSFVGMFKAVEQVAKGLRMDPETWGYCGLPFSVTVGMEKKPSQAREFPVARFALGDVAEFLASQVKLRTYLLGAPRGVALLGDGLEHEEGTQKSLAEAMDHITPGYDLLTPGDGIPATTETGHGVEDLVANRRALEVADENNAEDTTVKTITGTQFAAMRDAAKAAGTSIVQVFKTKGWKIPEGGMSQWPAADYQKVLDAIGGKP